MLDYSMMIAEGILVLKPTAPLSKEDFAGVSAAVDTYLSTHPALHGVMIQAKEFPGWEDFGGFTAHMKFVRDHHQKVERIAVVTDSPMGGLAESLGNHFTSADVRHFRYSEEETAMEWLERMPVSERISYAPRAPSTLPPSRR
jgi:SpoIIAA-like